MRRSLLALLIVLATVPTIEVLEQAAHLIEHGFGDDDHDLGHHDHDDDGANGCAELSRIYGAAQAVPSARAATLHGQARVAHLVTHRPVDPWRDRGSSPPPYRPPIG